MKNHFIFRTLVLFLFISNFQYTMAQIKIQEPDNLQASYNITINAPIEKVWEVLAVDFGGIGKWASGVNHSKSVGDGKAHQGATCDERACKINAPGFSNAKERIVVFDSSNHILAYTIYEGVPGFVKNFKNQWTLVKQGDGVLLTGTSTMRATGIMGWMMRGLMRSSTRKVLRNMGEELKHYVEKNGQVHPRKASAMEKYNRKQNKKTT